MKKKSFKQIRDTIYNNSRADRQSKDDDDKIEDENRRITLYDENDDKMKMIDRIIRAYQAKKLMLKAQEIQQENIEEQKRTDFIKRMIKGYNKNRDKIANKPEQPELSQSEKRKRKLADLNSRSNSWKGLESFSDYTGKNQ
jgi:hypothetical protein